MTGDGAITREEKVEDGGSPATAEAVPRRRKFDRLGLVGRTGAGGELPPGVARDREMS